MTTLTEKEIESQKGVLERVPGPPRPVPSAQDGSREGAAALNLGVPEGPVGRQFLIDATEDESSSWSDGLEGGGVQYGGQKRRWRKDKKYGHQEDDLDYFRATFESETKALQHLDLGEDFKYPSDEAFARYFPEFDFLKAMRGNNILRKWDGTVRGYPGFKQIFYQLIYVQREHYIHKILALEQLVPDSVKKELFQGLQYTVDDLGQRLERLEDRYGGQEKQVELIVNDLQRLQSKGRVPYPELRAAVRDVEAFLGRPSTLPGTGETLVVLLKKVVPKHFKTQFKDTMHQWGQPCTGNNFVDYLKRKLTYEIDENEEAEKKEDLGKKNGHKKEKKPKTPGKLSKVAGKVSSDPEQTSPGESGAMEGKCGVTSVKKELPDCKCCNTGKHLLHNCRKFFLIFNLKEKVAFAKEQKVCFKCLRGDHDLRGCPFRKKADCRFCASHEHHFLLCPGGNEVKLAAAGKAGMPKLIPEDKGEALTIHGNVGIISGHKVSVG